MSAQYFARGGRRGAAGTSSLASDAAILAAASHLTARDRLLVRAVAEHRVLTTSQVAALGFGSVITARHRLSVLVEVGALRRFRPHREVGSAPWHYLLGPVGAVLLGVEDGDERKWLTAVRADRQIALERSQRLAHLTGVNGFFAALAAHARQAGDATSLATWLNEIAAREWLFTRLPQGRSYLDVPNPDGLGVWAEDGHETTFLFEYDTGSEHLPQLTAKLPGYGNLAEAFNGAGLTLPLLLFCFPAPRRELSARRAITGSPDTPALRIATTSTDPGHASPAGPVWLPLLPGWSRGPVPLSALDAALPDPWLPKPAPPASARDVAAQPAKSPRHRNPARRSTPYGRTRHTRTQPHHETHADRAPPSPPTTVPGRPSRARPGQ